ncbi:MAG TPA: protease modulator HflC [Myxococcota bacterium]|nr:protease modulator HflC [Myxococcota bacterium]
MRRLLFLGLVALAVFAALVWAGNVGLGPLVITREGEQKIVLRLGDPVAVVTEPGVSGRIPLLDDVITYEKRRLYLNGEPLHVQTRDQEPLDVDNYVIWRIADPLLFRRSFPLGRQAAEEQVDQVVRSDLRDVIGRYTLQEVVTGKRVEIIQEITEKSGATLGAFGIQIDDVRLNRTELPAATEKNVYARMRTERERLARKARAEGEGEGRRLRADADRDALVIVAEAKRDADVLRGAGDAEAARIYAEAYGKDADFYRFVRSLEAYRKTIDARTTLVVPPQSEFFRILGSGREGRSGP